MKKKLMNEISIPEGVEVKIEGDTITVKGEGGELRRKFSIKKMIFEKNGNKIILGKEISTKNDKKRINTMKAHIKNMLNGAKEKFEYELKVVSSHFPITVEINGNVATVKNFLGEKIPRKVKIIDGVDVSINKDVISIKSNSKESAGQTAANFEAATKIRMRDRRIFQDGIFLTSKSGRKI